MRLRLSLREISKSYGDVPVLKDCTQTFIAGVTAIKAPSQSGKTTLLKMCALLEPPTSGKLDYFYPGGRPLEHDLKLMRKITLVLPYGTIFNTTAWKNVTCGLKIRGMKRKEVKSLATEALNKVGLYDKKKRNAFSLTRGECRRLLLARAMAFDPDVLLLDEPVRGLDERSVNIIENVIAGLKRSSDPPTILMTTSNGDIAEGLADRTLMIKSGSFAVSRTFVSDEDYACATDSNGSKEKLRGTEFYIDRRFFK